MLARIRLFHNFCTIVKERTESQVMQENLKIQGIPGLKRKLPNSRSSRPWKKTPQIQGITGLERKLPKFKAFQALKENFPNSRNSRPRKKTSQIQGIPGLERKILKFKEFQALKENSEKFKEFQALKEKSPNPRISRFSSWCTDLVGPDWYSRHSPVTINEATSIRLILLASLLLFFKHYPVYWYRDQLSEQLM